jgi:eukaryotic-like serine/threonine-protein kinase
MDTVTYKPPDLDEVLAEYFREVDAGRADPAPFLSLYPHLAAELAAVFADLDRVSGWTKPLQELHLAVATLPPDGNNTLPWTETKALPPVPVFGDYELLEHIGEGGMGVVYKAWQKSLKRPVALKMIRSGQFASPADLQRFRNEAELVGNLDDTHIVPIYYVGEHDGRLYYTMKLIEGGNLASRLDEFRLPAPGAAPASRREVRDRQVKLVQLLRCLARSVNHAHRRGILHRDLKPGNVLLDPQGEPHITDFGLAKRFEGETMAEESGLIVGTASYMSPEQASGRTRGLTTAVDVYSLGAMFYELLTGQPPFRGDNFLETLQQVREREPVPPRSVNPHVDRDLETICLKCLEKDPKRRYRSAERLAESLECWLAGKPIPDSPITPLERFVRWCRRHPASASLTAGALLLLMLVMATALTVARSRAARLEEEVLRSNVYAAQGVAGTVLWHLEHLSEPVVQIAEGPELRQSVGKGVLGEREKRKLQVDLDRMYGRLADQGFVDSEHLCAFQSIHFINREGDVLVDSPSNLAAPPRHFPGRDYLVGALRHAGQTGRAAAHISRVYQSELDTLSKFAISVPVHANGDASSDVIGVVVATITTASTLGMLHLNDERRIAVLVGRADTNPPRGPPLADPTVEYRVLVHPAYRRGEPAMRVGSDRLLVIHQPRPGNEFQLPDPQGGRATDAMDHDYRDPFAERDRQYAGSWLAGFAPVGNTGLVVIVQQRRDEAIPFDAGVWWTLAAIGGGVLFLAIVIWLIVQRTRGTR